jgi:hypothetical protein
MCQYSALLQTYLQVHQYCRGSKRIQKHSRLKSEKRPHPVARYRRQNCQWSDRSEIGHI